MKYVCLFSILSVVIFTADVRADRLDNYRAQVISLNPVGYYTLDETSGTTAVNLSGSAPDGAYIADPNLLAGGLFADVGGSAVQLNGSTQWIQVPDDDSLDMTRQVSFAMFVRINQFMTTWTPLIWKGNGSADSGRNYAIWIQNNGNMSLTSADASGQQYVQTWAGSIQLGQWYHIVGVIDRDAGVKKIFINGRLVASGSIRTNDMVTTTYDLQIGWRTETYSGHAPVNGVLDEVAIFPTALTDAQVRQLYLSAAGTFISAASPAWLHDLTSGGLSQIALNFSSPMNMATISPSDFALQSPDGQYLPITSIADNGTDTIILDFPVQTAAGNYTLTAGYDMLDTDGHPLDHDRNGLPGQPEDIYTLSLHATSDPALYSGLVAYWGFDDDLGMIARDYTGNGNDGEIWGDAHTVPGIFGNAYTFDGSGDWVKTPVDIQSSAMPQLTIIAWVRNEGANSYRGEIINNDDGAYDRGHYYNTDSNGYSILKGNGVLPSYETRRGKWFFLAATWDDDDCEYWVNNTKFTSNAAASVSTILAGIGYSPRYGGYFNGLIDEVMIFDRRLNDQEVAALMRETTADWPQPDLQIRTDDEQDFIGDQIIDDLNAQTRTYTVRPGLTAVYDIVLSVTGLDLPSPVVIKGPAGAAGWTILYEDTYTGQDYTAEITGAGLPLIAYQSLKNLTILITPDQTIPDQTVYDVILTAEVSDRPDIFDQVRMRNVVDTRIPEPPLGKVYTLNADFDLGTLNGVSYESVPDQLQLSEGATTLPYMWIPNSDTGTISKINTETGREIGKYCVGPTNANPSRTTVDVYGNCWVGNRDIGTAVKVGLIENGQYIDRNVNGKADTCRDLDGDGIISDAEVLPWGQDECVMFEVVVIPGKEGTYTPATYNLGYNGSVGPRGIAIDANGNCWVGCRDTRIYYYVDGQTGQIIRSYDFSHTGHKIYGAVVDENGILWSSGQDNNTILWLDPTSGDYDIINMGIYCYGINIDGNGHVYVSHWTSTALTQIDINTKTVNWTIPGRYQSRGVAITDDQDIWTANSSLGTVTRWRLDLAQNAIAIADIPVGNQPTGVSVDADGYVWVVNYGDDYVKRIDPATNQVDIEKYIRGHHYGYSDMTGIVSRSATSRTGTWSVLLNSKAFDTPWGALSWNADIPWGNLVQVRVRSSNDRRNWSFWEDGCSRCPLRRTPNGRYLQISATLSSLVADTTPILYDLSIWPSPVCGDVNHPYPTADITNDCVVDIWDLNMMASQWLINAAP